MLKILLLLLSFSTMAEELLSAAEAFKFNYKIVDNSVQIDFKIADGYYLYQNKINVKASDDTQLGNYKFSKAKIKDDAFFGKVAVYRNFATVSVPIIKANNSLNLEVTYQGCADLGVCYPPIIKKITLKNITTKHSKKELNSILQKTSQMQDPVNVDLAFAFKLAKIDNKNLAATWKIRDDYYLYSNKFSFSIKGAELGTIKLPKEKIKDDAFFGKTEIYKKNLKINIPLKNIKSNNIEVSVNYQGSYKNEVYYPPVQKITKFDFSKKDKIIIKDKIIKNTLILQQTVKKEKQRKTEKIKTEKIKTEKIKKDQIAIKIELNETDKIANLFDNRNLYLVLLSFFGFGLLLSFTPCVLPMIPILSGLIIGEKQKPSSKRAFIMSLVFVLAMSFSYAIAGILSGTFGGNLQASLQNPIVLIIFSSIFVVLAFSMFGYFEIKLPNFMQAKLTNLSNKQKSGHLIGAAIMGFLSALIVGPCVAPPLAGALIYIGQTGDATLGGLALFIMSIGMGVPLIMIGTGMSKMPSSGAWMNNVKYVFGVVMLAMAIYFLDRIIPPLASLVLWALLFTISSIALGAISPIAKNTNIWQRIFKAIGMIVLGYGILLWLLVAKGGGDMFAPLKGFIYTSQINKQHLQFTKITSLPELEEKLKTDKLLMLDFYADWCISCKEFEKFTLSDTRVVNILKDFELVQADVTANDNSNKNLLNKFNIIGPPAILFFKNGKELKHKRIVGYKNADKFLRHLQKL